MRLFPLLECEDYRAGLLWPESRQKKNIYTDVHKKKKDIYITALNHQNNGHNENTA